MLESTPDWSRLKENMFCRSNSSLNTWIFCCYRPKWVISILYWSYTSTYWTFIGLAQRHNLKTRPSHFSFDHPPKVIFHTPKYFPEFNQMIDYYHHLWRVMWNLVRKCLIICAEYPIIILFVIWMKSIESLNVIVRFEGGVCDQMNKRIDSNVRSSCNNWQCKSIRKYSYS